MSKASLWIQKLGLLPHPEGGHFREIYKSGDTIPKTGLPERFSGKRACATAIYYLLEAGEASGFHRILSDELWHFYKGDPLIIHILDPETGYTTKTIGEDFGFIAVVPHGVWFAAEPLPQETGIQETECKSRNHGYSLVGCTVSPGFDFGDFEMAKAKTLSASFPDHAFLIQRLCIS